MIEMKATELNEYIAKNPKTVLIDVRETWEYNVAFIKDSIHIPISQIISSLLRIIHIMIILSTFISLINLLGF